MAISSTMIEAEITRIGTRTELAPGMAMGTPLPRGCAAPAVVRLAVAVAVTTTVITSQVRMIAAAMTAASPNSRPTGT